MPLAKKTTICIVFTLISVSFFSGCIFDNIFGVSFSIDSCNLTTKEGFAGLNVSFTCSGTVTIKLVGPNNFLLDSDTFFKGSHYKIFHMSNYMDTVSTGNYIVKAYDTDNNEISTQTYTFKGADLTINSCEQKWWERDPWIGGHSLIGLRLNVTNNGDVPAFPYNVLLDLDSSIDTNLAIPVIVFPGESQNVDCFVYRESEPENSTFTVSIEDKDENTLASETFSVDVEYNVVTKQFIWEYGGRRKPNVPIPDYLYEYYSNVDPERNKHKDYALYVFSPYDELYIDVLIECLMFTFTGTEDLQKINYIASFVQNLDYQADSDTDDSYEYPRYPVETLFDGDNGRGDCEDKAILAASILYKMGYDVSLIRLPNHMAVGVKLSESALPGTSYYIDDYYFLETTTPGKSCGSVPNDYADLASEASVHPITDRALLVHEWEDNNIIIYTNTEFGDFVQVSLYVENLGLETARDIKVIAGFYTISDLTIDTEDTAISLLLPNYKKKVTLSVDIPVGVESWFITKLYYDHEVVDKKESASSFPAI